MDEWLANWAEEHDWTWMPLGSVTICMPMSDPVFLAILVLVIIGVILSGVLFAILFQLQDTAAAATLAATSAAEATAVVANLLAVTTPRTADSPPPTELAP